MTPPLILHIGGICEIGLSPDGQTLLVISHSGKGILSTSDWSKLARDNTPDYPDSDHSPGIGNWSTTTYKTTGLWNPVSPSLVSKLQDLDDDFEDLDDLRGIEVTHDGSKLVVATTHELSVYPLNSNKRMQGYGASRRP